MRYPVAHPPQPPPMRAAIYSRVSTMHQNTENQVDALREVATKRGWRILTEIEDKGISGAKGREKRPGLDRCLKAAERRMYDVLLVWSLDRLGRSLQDLIHTLADLNKAGVRLYIHQQNIDTTTPAGKAMFQMLGVFAEFEREMIRERVNSGLARARKAGKKPGPVGLSATDPERYERIRGMLMSGVAVWRVHKDTGTGHQTVKNIKKAIDAEIFQQQGA